MDPLEQKSKLAVLMELMKKADDAEASKLQPPGDEPEGLEGLLGGDADDAKSMSHMDMDGADAAPKQPDADGMGDDELQKLMAMYQSLK